MLHGRAATKGATPAVRLAGMRLAVAVVDGLSPLDRNAAAVQAEAWKLYERGSKVTAAWRQGREWARVARRVVRLCSRGAFCHAPASS